MYLNSSSNSYEKKYLKYKNKYNVLKIQHGGAKGTLHGGDCHPLPDEEDVDFYGESLLDLDPGERITIQNRCYAVESLYEWIINHNGNRLPDTQVMIHNNDNTG